MTVTVEFYKKGRIAHTRNFEIDDISELLCRLHNFCEYHLIANEIDVCECEEESVLFDQYINGTWYAYTGRIVYVKNPYATHWYNEYADENGDTILV